MNSFVKVMDLSVAAMLFTRYKDILDLNTIGDSVLQYPKPIALREIAERRGKIEVEFINYWKSSIAPDWERSRTPAARRGMWLPYETKESGITTTINVKAMPVKIRYDIWFWSKDKDKLNKIIEAYMFWQHTDPNLSLNYIEQFPLEMDLHFGEIIDESIVAEKYEKGMYFVYRMPLVVDGWLFQSETPTSNIIHSIKIECYDKANNLVYTEVIPEHDDYDEQKVESLKLFSRTIIE